MRILVLNAGSTSLKFGLFASAQREPVISGAIDWASGRRCEAVIAYKEADFPPDRCTMKVADEQCAAEIALQTVTRRSQVDAVGHRVVYGGAGMSRRVTEEVKARILSGADSALA
jgi:acetate kinase